MMAKRILTPPGKFLAATLYMSPLDQEDISAATENCAPEHRHLFTSILEEINEQNDMKEILLSLVGMCGLFYTDNLTAKKALNNLDSTFHVISESVKSLKRLLEDVESKMISTTNKIIKEKVDSIEARLLTKFVINLEKQSTSNLFFPACSLQKKLKQIYEHKKEVNNKDSDSFLGQNSTDFSINQSEAQNESVFSSNLSKIEPIKQKEESNVSEAKVFPTKLEEKDNFLLKVPEMKQKFDLTKFWSKEDHRWLSQLSWDLKPSLSHINQSTKISYKKLINLPKLIKSNKSQMSNVAQPQPMVVDQLDENGQHKKIKIGEAEYVIKLVPRARNIFCKKCGQAHNTKGCTTMLDCTKCQKSGHPARYCPDYFAKPPCSCCGSGDHFLNNCSRFWNSVNWCQLCWKRGCSSECLKPQGGKRRFRRRGRAVRRGRGGRLRLGKRRRGR